MTSDCPHCHGTGKYMDEIHWFVEGGAVIPKRQLGDGSYVYLTEEEIDNLWKEKE